MFLHPLVSYVLFHWQVQSYLIPHLFLWPSLCLIYCKGGRTESEILAWLKKKTGPPATFLDSLEAAKTAIEEKDVYVVGFFMVCELLVE